MFAQLGTWGSWYGSYHGVSKGISHTEYLSTVFEGSEVAGHSLDTKRNHTNQQWGILQDR